MFTIEQLKQLKESEDHVEFKKGEGGNIAYNGGSKTSPSERRRCILGYVTLMRIGEELKPMSDEVLLKILQEQEPDFSQQVCENLTLSDLDLRALEVMKEKYALKQNNPRFRALSDYQVLVDLDLLKDGKLTNAALILLGKEDILKKYLPQCAVMLEYRNTESQIHFDNRYSFRKAFFLLIDELWQMIDLRNGSVPIQEGAYIFNIPFFNEEVIRESVNNAITHRDYRRNGEIVIKQYPKRLDVVNPGSFPFGVTIDNLLTVPSTPRNRLLADVLQKTGVVERSGQGIDKIFYNTLMEGKTIPDYSKSDCFNVYLSISSVIEDQAFALFIESVQSSLPENRKLSVFEIVTLEQIKRGINRKKLDIQSVKSLLQRKLIEKKGHTNGIYYLLSKEYYVFTDQKAEYIKLTDWDEDQAFNVVRPYLEKYGKIKMGEIVCLFEGRLTRKQTRKVVDKLVERKWLNVEGKGSGTYYILSPAYEENVKILQKAMNIGLNEMMKECSSSKDDN